MFPASVPWRKANVIIVLGLGVQRTHVPNDIAPNPASYGRLLTPYRLLRECSASGGACKVLLSGGEPDGIGRSEAEVYADVLHGLGVDFDQLLIEHQSRNTWDNAKFSSSLLHEHDDALHVLVTSRVHLYRALQYFPHYGATTIIGWWSDDLAVTRPRPIHWYGHARISP